MDLILLIRSNLLYSIKVFYCIFRYLIDFMIILDKPLGFNFDEKLLLLD